MADTRYRALLHEVLGSGEAGGSRFGHPEHLRLAWRYLCSGDPHTAEEWMCQAIRHIAVAHGSPGRYHQTLTVAWVRIVAGHHPRRYASFDDLVASCPALLDRSLPERHFSPALLWSADARARWVEPDLRPLLVTPWSEENGAPTSPFPP